MINNTKWAGYVRYAVFLPLIGVLLIGPWYAAFSTKLWVGDNLSAGRTVSELTVDGRRRYYVLYIPGGLDQMEPAPLILAFHGGGSSPRNFSKITQLDSRAGDQHGFVIAYPAGYKRFWHSGDDCCGPPYEQNIDDVAFVRAVLDNIEARVRIDKSRIYAAGFSNGGKMTYRVACELSTRITAIAVNASSLGIANCNPERPVPILHFHGTADTFHPYERGRGTATKYQMIQTGVPDTIRRWVKWNGCTNETQVTYQKGDATCVAHKSCKNSAQVIMCTIEGMGHQWPGYTIRFPRRLARKLGPSTNDLSATEMLIKFFETVK